MPRTPQSAAPSGYRTTFALDQCGRQHNRGTIADKGVRTGSELMLGVALTADEIMAAPPEVRRWIEQEIACSVGLVTTLEPATRASALSSTECNVEHSSENAGGRIPAVDSQGDQMKGTRVEAIRNLIATRAYELWENEGQPHGRDQIHWRQAEHEIMSCIGDGEPGPSEEGAQAKA